MAVAIIGKINNLKAHQKSISAFECTNNILANSRITRSEGLHKISLFLSGKCLWTIDKNYNNNNNTCKQLL